MDSKRTIVTTDRLSISYENGKQTLEAIRDPSISIRENEFVSFIGPSGCGKTALLRLIPNRYLCSNASDSIAMVAVSRSKIDGSMSDRCPV